MTVRARREGAMAIVVAEGRYDVSELRAAFEAALAPFTVAAADGLLLDVSGSQVLGERSAQDVRLMGHFVASRADRFSHRFAIVASSDLGFGLMRLGSVVTESQGVTTHVFRDHASALAWLGATPT